MSFETNKYDFEKALESMEDVVADLSNVILNDYVEILLKVINEYSGHFQSNIEDLEDECEALKDKVETLESELVNFKD